MKLTYICEGDKFKKNIEDGAERWEQAMTAAVNMAASMMLEEVRADIEGAGKFGDLAASVSVKVEEEGEGIAITIGSDDPRFGLFETGGTVQGNPLLWLPFSGTDAEGVRAGEYGGQLFSVQPREGHPLLFSMADKLPKYFGIESVTIPKKFHVNDIATSVMANFRQIFDAEMSGG